MKNAQQQFDELVALTSLYLAQEHPKRSWLDVDGESYGIFKSYASQNKQTVKRCPSSDVMPMPQQVKVAVVAPKPVVSNELTERKATIEKEEKKPIVEMTEKKLPPENKENLQREKIDLPLEQDFSDIQKIVSEKFPKIEIVDLIPSDKVAKDIKHGWKQGEEIQVMLFSLPENEKNSELLENIAKAIKKFSISTKLCFGNNFDAELKAMQSQPIKLILLSSACVSLFSDKLKKGSQHYYLGSIPAIILEDFPVYFNQPQAKIALWNQLKATLKQ